VRIRLATFNIENLGRRSGGTLAIEARRPTLQAQLARLDADILCLQEVNAQEGAPGPARRLRDLDAVLSGTPYAAFERACTLRKSGVGPLDIHNLVTLSRWPIRHSRQLWNEMVAPPSYQPPTMKAKTGASAAIAWDRPILLSEIAITPERALHVINLHLRAPIAAHLADQKLAPGAWKSVSGWAEGFFVAAVKRTGQALEARLAIDEIFDADAGALIAVAGDSTRRRAKLPCGSFAATPRTPAMPSLPTAPWWRWRRAQTRAPSRWFTASAGSCWTTSWPRDRWRSPAAR